MEGRDRTCGYPESVQTLPSFDISENVLAFEVCCPVSIQTPEIFRGL